MSDKGIVLVYGGTGLQGCPIVNQLLSEGYRVRVLSRQAEPNIKEGVEAVIGSFDKANSLTRATQGVTYVVLVLPIT
jgi:uncharacterized protein YbjT (DUF2867 family)